MTDHDLKEPLNKLTDLAKENWPDNKWELLYNFSLKVFDFEVQRFHKIDEKATKFITAISIIITIFLALFTWITNSSNINFSFYIYLFSIIVFSVLCISWYFVFQSLRLMPIKSLDLNDSLLKKFDDNNISSLHVSIYKSCKYAVEHRRGITENKTSLLSKGFKAASFAGLILLVLTVAVSVETLIDKYPFNNEKKEISMSDEKAEQKENENEPNLDIEDSGVHVALESCKPEIPNIQELLNESEDK